MHCTVYLPMPLDIERLFGEHHEPLFRYLVRLTGDRDAAADATQEAFVRMIEQRPEDRSPRAWLYAVATNHVRESARTRSRRQELLEEHGERLSPDPPRPADETVEVRRRFARAQRILSQLTERDRTLLLLQAEGFKHREIAEAVGTTTGSVGTMIARALHRVAELLESPEGAHG